MTIHKALSLLGLTLVIFFAAATLQGEEPRPIYVITLSDDIIGPVMGEYISQSIDKAEKERAECLILQLDTPGGLLTSTRSIVKKIMNASIPVVVYASPSGARAGSAGVFITLAGHIAAMAPSTNIGAAHPVSINEKRSTGKELEELFDALKGKTSKEEKPTKNRPTNTMEEKVLNDTVAWAESIAKGRGRNAQWAAKAVTESVSITEQEALELNVIDLVAVNLQDLLNKIDGKEVRLISGVVKINTKDASVIELPKNFRLKALSTLAHPTIAYILLMFGIYGLLLEFSHPGAGLPGIAGVICLVLAGFGLNLLPTNYAGVALIIIALILFIAEVKITSYGLLTIGGLISMFLGSLILFSTPYKFMRVSFPVILAFTSATFVVALFLTTIVLRSHKKRVTTGAEGMLGETAEVIEWEGVKGKVFVHGEFWDAASNIPLEKGSKVKIVKIEGMKLIVTKS